MKSCSRHLYSHIDSILYVLYILGVPKERAAWLCSPVHKEGIRRKQERKQRMFHIKCDPRYLLGQPAYKDRRIIPTPCSLLCFFLHEKKQGKLRHLFAILILNVVFLKCLKLTEAPALGLHLLKAHNIWIEKDAELCEMPVYTDNNWQLPPQLYELWRTAL